MTDVIHRDPDVMHGTPCFAGTRVPVRNLFDYLAHGRPLDAFFDDFPGVRREQALAVIDAASRALGVTPINEPGARAAAASA